MARLAQANRRDIPSPTKYVEYEEPLLKLRENPAKRTVLAKQASPNQGGSKLPHSKGALLECASLRTTWQWLSVKRVRIPPGKA